MTPQTFIRRLEEGKVNNLISSRAGQEGLVSVWWHKGSLILTWEECPTGHQYDESTYTRDDRQVFSNLKALLKFMADHGLEAEAFTD